MTILLAALLHIETRGYGVGIGNHAIQIPLMKSYFDAALFPGDAMVATRTHYPSVYFVVIGAVTQALGDHEGLFFFLHVLTETVRLAAWYRLGRIVHPGAGWIAVVLGCSDPLLLGVGKGRLDGTYHTHAAAAQPFVLWALAWFLEGRRTRAYALLGIAFNVHALSAAYAAAMLGLASLASVRRDGARRTARDFGVFSVCALPGLVWVLAAVSSSAPAPPSWLYELRLRSSHHCFPLSWPAGAWAGYLALVATGALSWVRVNARGESRPCDRAAPWMALAVLLLCALGLLFAEWVPNETILRAQLFRSTRWLTVLILAYAAGGLACAWTSGRGGRLLALLGGAVLFLAGGAKGVPYVLAPLLLMLPPLPRLPAWCLALNASALLAYAATGPDAGQLGRIVEFLTRAGASGRVIVLGGLLLAVLSARRMRPGWDRAAILVIVLGIALLGVGPRLYRAAHPPLAERSAWLRLQLWARARTPQDAIFLTPPDHMGFRVYSERGTVVEWKDGTQQVFDTAYSAEWWKRMRKVGGRSRHRYEALTAEQLIALQEEFGITYAVFGDAKALPFPIVHAADTYRVFRLPARPAPDP